MSFGVESFGETFIIPLSSESHVDSAKTIVYVEVKRHTLVYISQHRIVYCSFVTLIYIKVEFFQ